MTVGLPTLKYSVLLFIVYFYLPQESFPLTLKRNPYFFYLRTVSVGRSPVWSVPGSTPSHGLPLPTQSGP